MTRLKTTAKLLALSIATIVLMGCAADMERQTTRLPSEAEIEQYNAAVAPEDRIICRNEKPFGTRISQKVCRRAGAIEEVSALSQREWRRISNY